MALDFEQYIKQSAKKHLEEIASIRQYLHQNPELSFEESQTARYITKLLQEMAIPVKTGIAGNGVLASIEGGKGAGKHIAIRAELDALPIQEENDHNYCSRNVSVMHACGHDVHMAIAIGVAKILNQIKEEIPGRITLIFQPAEEKLPGGAQAIMESGVLSNPPVDIILANHVFPELEAGKVGFRSGMYMASTDELYLTVIGKGGHAALREQIVDPIIMTAKTILQVHENINSNRPSDIPTVISFGRIEALGATNVIPDKVAVQGTFRTMDESWRDRAHDIIRETASKICETEGGSCSVEIKRGYPFLENDQLVTEGSQKAATDFLGADKVIDLPLRMTADDFAYYGQHYQACYYRLGTNSKELQYERKLHTSTFDIDENALEIGMGLMSWITLRHLFS